MKKALLSAVLRFAAGIAGVLLLVPIRGGDTVPWRIFLFFGRSDLTKSLWFILICGAACLAVTSLGAVLRFWTEKRLHICIRWNRLLTAVLLCVLGVLCIRSRALVFIVFGMLMVAAALRLVWSGAKSVRAQVLRNRKGGALLAEVVGVSSETGRDGTPLWLVTCREGSRYYHVRTPEETDSSVVGSKVWVKVEPGRPDLYKVDLETLFRVESEVPPSAADAPAAVSAKSAVPDSAARQYSWRWGKAENAPPCGQSETILSASDDAEGETSRP